MENGHANENGHGLTNGDTTTVHMDYSTDFPSLPITASNGATSSKESAWSRPRPMQSKNSTVTFVVPPNERTSSGKNLLGNQPSEEHKRCANVAQATGCRIELSESKDGSLTVIIQGPRGKVDEARNRVIRELQTQDTFKLPIPKDHHRKIIGKEGNALKSLEQQTGCSIKIPKREVASDIIEITGPSDGIRSAVEEIRRISSEEANNAVENIVCPRFLYPFIKGPENETYNKLTSELGIKLNIPPSHVTNEIINISGPKDGVHQAATLIKKIIAEKQNTVKTLVIQVAKCQHRHIIGRERKGLHEILAKTNVWVEVPEQDEQSDNLTLRGNPADLPAALEMVYTKASSQIVQSLECPVFLRRYIIGKGGQELTKLLPNREKLHVDFDESGHIFLEGPPEEVMPAFTTLEACVKKLIDEKAKEVLKIHPDFHRHIIGSGGANLKKIKGDNDDLIISFPREKGPNSDEVTIEGPKKDVQRAVEEIKSLVSKHENEKSKDVVIEQRFHKLLIGQKGANITKIRDQYPSVNISFPEANKTSDIIQLRGDRKDVDAVAILLTKDLKDIKESNYQESVPIFKDCHKHIIGKGGENIKKIRETTNTKIDMPSGNSGDDRIIITGKQGDVAKAVQALINIQTDQANISSVELEIPTKVQARLLGGGRRLIQDIETECGSVHIRFPTEKSASTKVTIKGHKDDVEKAEKLLSALAKDKEQDLTEDTVTAKAEFHRFLIGKKGDKIKSYRGNMDVRIMFPRETDSDKETIHLLGKKEDVEEVKKSLQSAIKELNETVTIEMDVSKDYHSHFTKNRGAILRNIQDQNGSVQISFPPITSDSVKVSIKGSQSCVEAAKEAIEEAVNDMEHSVTIEVDIPQNRHGLILGQKRQRLLEIQSKHNVSISFPGKEKNSSIVTISGRDTKVEAARDELLGLLPVERKLDVPHEIQQELKKDKWHLTNELTRTHNVQIKLPHAEDNSETITLSGEAQDVEAVIEILRQKMEQFYELRVDVPLEYHWEIRGEGKGKGVKRLEFKYGVTFFFPSKEDHIIIRGPEEKTKECEAEILATVEELRALFTQEISIDHRIHGKLRGYDRKNLAKLEKQYRVKILIPGRPSDPDLVMVAGSNEDDVFSCIEHLKDEEEDHVRNLERGTHSVQHRTYHQSQPAVHSSGAVVINNAPWQMDAADFPEMSNTAAPAQPVGGAWGGQRRW